VKKLWTNLKKNPTEAGQYAEPFKQAKDVLTSDNGLPPCAGCAQISSGTLCRHVLHLFFLHEGD
jgi:hypothetical protein